MSLDRRILIADDDRELRAGMVELLGPLARIVEVDSGAEALTVLRRRSIHLALLDMHMPGHTGLEVLAVVRRETLAIPCIFWSGDMTEALRAEALREGALAVLRKPIEPDVLRREVLRILQRDART